MAAERAFGAAVRVVWGMGLAVLKVVSLCRLLGVEVGQMSAWRDVKWVREQVRRLGLPGRVRVLGVDGFWVREAGKVRGMVITCGGDARGEEHGRAGASTL
ncbi:MAG: hypothetical protein NZL98_06370 [Anaerolineales bacterium]|nr:hypothetical protein [Anaerolineales bacterium]MDW8226882.1 hypothetical protein [Anaerolineales bacterium]